MLEDEGSEEVIRGERERKGALVAEDVIAARGYDGYIEPIPIKLRGIALISKCKLSQGRRGSAKEIIA